MSTSDRKPPFEILQDFPGLKYATLKRWMKAGDVHTFQNPGHRSRRLCSKSMVAAMMADLHCGALPDEFEDEGGERWTWQNLIIKKYRKQHINAVSIREWHRKGHPAWDGNTLELIEKKAIGNVGSASRRRVYVKESDIKLMIKWRGEHRKEDGEWVGRKTAKAMGVSWGALARHSGKGGKAHPALGRLIDRRHRTAAVGKRGLRIVEFRKSDLTTILQSAPPDRTLWATHDQIKSEYDVHPAQAAKMVKTIWAPSPPQPGHRPLVLYFSRTDLRQIAASDRAGGNEHHAELMGHVTDIRSGLALVKNDTGAIRSRQRRHSRKLETINEATGKVVEKMEQGKLPFAVEDKLMPADHFLTNFHLATDTLNRARRDGRLKRSIKRGGRWYHSTSEVRSIYPKSFADD